LTSLAGIFKIILFIYVLKEWLSGCWWININC